MSKNIKQAANFPAKFVIFYNKNSSIQCLKLLNGGHLLYGLLGIFIWALTRENLSSVFANNKGADQSAHPRILISTFVIHSLESIISRLATSKISLFWLVSVADQAGLNLNLSETPDSFCRVWPV